MVGDRWAESSGDGGDYKSNFRELKTRSKRAVHSHINILGAVLAAVDSRQTLPYTSFLRKCPSVAKIWSAAKISKTWSEIF